MALFLFILTIYWLTMKTLGFLLLFALTCISIFTLYYRVQVLVRHKYEIGKHHSFIIPHTELVQVLGSRRRASKILVRKASMVQCIPLKIFKMYVLSASCKN